MKYILDKIIHTHNVSGGHNGLFVTDFSGDFKEIKKELNKLYINKEIVIVRGIHGNLIKYNLKK